MKYRKSRKKSVADYAKKLQKNTPLSEQWFLSRWTIPKASKPFYQDKYNYPYGKYIPDVINFGYRYVIEVDGSVHNNKYVQFRDKKKDAYYKQRGFKVFRIKAYDEIQLRQIEQEVKDLILTYNN